MGIESRERDRTSSMLDCKHNVPHKGILSMMEIKANKLCNGG